MKKKTISKIIRHIKKGTFLRALRKKLFGQSYKDVTQWSVTNSRSAIIYLCRRITEFQNNEKEGKIILVGDSELYSDRIISFMNKRKIPYSQFNLNELNEKIILDPGKIAGIIILSTHSKEITAAARFFVTNPKYQKIPIEYVPLASIDYEFAIKNGMYNMPAFISPLLLNKTDIFEIYEESLLKFDKKCDIRDFMDLSQMVFNIIDNAIDGDIAEFGSYKGHSGYLLANLIKQTGSDKELYLFDMFEEFPKEDVGIDRMWNNTHQVFFNEVRQKFSDFNRVSLIKGDFTESFIESPIRKLALVYVDCDSYRSTRYLCEHIFEQVLEKGGAMIFEDYGHSPLLGNRIAVHEYFDNKKCIKYFSAFSGLYIVIKT
jgi:hypothetical protein